MNREKILEENLEQNSSARELAGVNPTLGKSSLLETQFLDLALILALFEDVDSASQTFEDFILERSYEMLFQSGGHRPLSTLLSYRFFLTQFVQEAKGVYEAKRVEFLLRQSDYCAFEVLKSGEVPLYLQHVEQDLISRQRKKCPWAQEPRAVLKRMYKTQRRRLAVSLASEHGFYTLIYVSLAVVVVGTVLMSMRNQSLSLIEMIWGWIEFLKSFF